MRQTLALVMASMMMLGMAIIPAAASSDTLEQHCPGAVSESSPGYVGLPEGHEIVLDNDTTGTYAQDIRNDTPLPAGTLVCIKGGPFATGILTADGTSTLKALLGEYVTVGQGNVPDVSYYMTYRLTTVEGQWCSPGFWRNSPIQAAAVAGSVDWSFLPEGATYLDVLNSPQTYGGGLFNQVGDALSAAHLGVDFAGERVEDSCPLRADAAQKVGAPVFGKKK